MKRTLVAACPLLVVAQGHTLPDKRVPPGVVRLDISRREDVPILSRRATSSVSADLYNNVTEGVYVTTVQIGTPPQKLTLQVDTGSSDTWAPYKKSQICAGGGCYYGSCMFSSQTTTNPPSHIADGVSFFAVDMEESSSFQVVKKGLFNISYGDGTSSTGDYFTDKSTIGGSGLAELVMGLGLDTDIPYGLVGVGFMAGESVDSDDQYLNLPYQMVKEDLIKTTAYSLWLNDLCKPKQS
jgi:hypothetical protein